MSKPERQSPHATRPPPWTCFGRAGFVATFKVEGGEFAVTASGRRYPPEQLRICDYFRFEGTSDPDDTSVVYALEAVDGTRGTLVDAYGAYADPAVATLVERIRVKAPERPRGKLDPL